MIQPGRLTAQIEGDFVVFLIGARINRWWKIHKWLPVMIAMPRMLKELASKPELGLLGFETYFGIPPLTVQYWRSFEHLEAYARNRDAAHLPAWKAFNKSIGSSGDVGVWHETFKVRAGEYEAIYSSMPPLGLGRATKLVQVGGAADSARGRIESQAKKT